MSVSTHDVGAARLEGQVIAVTGADQGYGKAISTLLAQAGASVVLIGVNAETLAAHASTIEARGGSAVPIKADVGVVMDWRSAQHRILEIFGALHGIVHLADKRAQSSFATLSENEWMDLFNCNVKSSVAITQIVRRHLPRTWITLIGPHLDEVGLQAHPQRGALRSLVEHAELEEVRANLVLPGRKAAGDDTLDAALAEAVLSLSLPELSHVSGTIMRVPLPPLPRLRPQERDFEGARFA